MRYQNENSTDTEFTWFSPKVYIKWYTSGPREQFHRRDPDLLLAAIQCSTLIMLAAKLELKRTHYHHNSMVSEIVIVYSSEQATM